MTTKAELLRVAQEGKAHAVDHHTDAYEYGMAQATEWKEQRLFWQRMIELIEKMPEEYGNNEACLKDGLPCAPNGDGGCVACDDGRGHYLRQPSKPAEEGK